jgi:hypothetical protein
MAGVLGIAEFAIQSGQLSFSVPAAKGLGLIGWRQLDQ